MQPMSFASSIASAFPNAGLRLLALLLLP